MSTPLTQLLAERLPRYHGKTIVISGATGYVGSALVHALRAVDCRLVLLVHDEPVTRPAPGDECIRGDVSQRGTWQKAIPRSDYVFHLAAREHKHGSDGNPALDLQVNVLAVVHLLEACREQPRPPKVIVASSANVVGQPATLPVDEAVPDAPLAPFSINKLTAEKYLEYYAREFQLCTAALRLANVYGPVPNRDVAERVILNRIISKAVAGEPLTLFNNQSCVRDYVFIDDVVAAFLLAGASPAVGHGQPFLIGSGVGHRIREAFDLIADRVGGGTRERPMIRTDLTVMLDAIELRHFVADTGRFRSATGWAPEVSLEDGVDRTIEYFRATMRLAT